ncbi:MAG: hypothetical protein Q8O67_12000 [Deltaproteobacteria bacterium]|nr:hypothetical protein [Deltaproteobacteria bacterium]
MEAAVGLRALGMLQNDPLRGPVALRLLDGLIALPSDADGLGAATLVDGNALLSRAKLTQNTQRLSSLIGTPQGRAAVVQIGTRSELRPTGLDQTQNLGPFRARSYAAAVVGGPQGADEAATSRERLLAGLPDFLQRCVSGQSEAEAFFLAILAQLHRKGVLESNHDNGHVLLDAVQAVLSTEEGGVGVARHIALTNGVDVLHVARGLPSAVITISGLPEDVAGSISPAFVDSSTARERNRRYRGVFALGALELTLKAATVMPQRATLQVLPDVAAVLIGRDLSVRVL